MLDIGISDNMSLPIYSSLVLLGPAFLTWGFMMVALLKAYQLGNVTTVAPIAELSALANVIASYIFLKDREKLPKK